MAGFEETTSGTDWGYMVDFYIMSGKSK